MNYKRTLLAVYGLPVIASDAEIEQAIAAARATATNAQREFATTSAAVELLAAEVTKFRTLATNALLTTAINSGKISAAELDKMRESFATNFDVAAHLLEERRAILNTQSLGLQRTFSALEHASPEDRAKAFNSRLDDLMQPAESGGRGCTVEQAIEYMRGNPEDAALLRRMGDQNAR